MRDRFGHLVLGETAYEYLLDLPTAEREQAVRGIEFAGILFETIAL